ncbi:Crp/Fnr family transcriptional regulator [Sediminibacterium soli]|uniref:Crp/Fnr family transcriptional regulator n=1 Tax=Sediminibacterium soli TaxID=2698829 RepID=UPI00137B5AB0|nr:Crp/Fnr family transcriptional regulator [Sediminibacterium soli]NCI47883.1 Crp/Fnr family transcriptional regulator [Sediminibacterium soli]
MYEQLTRFIRSRISVSSDELERALAYSRFQTYKKGDCLLRVGEYCRFVAFLTRGLIVATIPDEDGHERASGFIYENCFFTYTEGLSVNQPSHKNLVALEDCETLMLDKEKLRILFREQPKFESLLTQLLADEVRSLLLHQQATKSRSLEERYLDLENRFPNAFQRIPQKYLADYLGIEAPSLSRLRKRLAGK